VLKITGYSCKELLDLSGGFYSLIVSDDHMRIQKLLDKFADNPEEEYYSAIYRIYSRDQNIVWVKEEIQVQKNITGEIEAYYGFIQNISEFKKLESLLLAENENLHQLNKSKDKFISILSHDLRAPFTSILGFSEILMNEPDLTQNEKNEYLNYIHESSQNQLQLINYLLDWSRLNTGRMKIESDRIHALSLVFNCIASLTGNAMRKNIDIRTNIPESIFIKADEKLISQVITNLLSNAIKFSYENKHIEISASIFNDDKIEFIIKDTGIGIPEHSKDKLFKVEKKFSTIGTKGEKGTGLGLSLVKEIVDKHMGDIWYYSEVDKGSEFHFTIPSSPNIILLVDDEKEDKVFLEKVINENYPGYIVLFSENGYEALTIISSKIPSLIIAKHDCPFMDGIQLLKLIRKGEKGFKVPVIALISDISEETKKMYYENTITAFLQKPFKINKIKEILSSALN
jgi:PAS domain S-box-containing protein